MTRRSVVGALVGLAFAAAAGVGLAQVTTGSSPSTAVTSTTESQTTTGDFENKSADDQESEDSDFDSQGNKNKHQSSTTLSTTSSTPLLTTSTPLTTSTTGDEAGSGQAKMDVCHKTGSGKEHTINIAAPAVPAHLAHGDTVGACVTTAPTTTSLSTTTSQSTTTTATTSHGKNPKKPKKLHASNHGKSSHGKGHNK